VEIIWDEDKNDILKRQRKISFEEVVEILLNRNTGVKRMKKTKIELDAYEQSIEDMADSFVPASPKTQAKFDAIIERARKNKSISLRLSAYDLEKVKERAKESGLPYQTLISMVVHKYITDQFWDKNEVKKTLQIYRSVGSQ
jgi:predicted DNA binding CopG/RHH family protein